MRSSSLQRKLVGSILALFVVPTLLAGAVLVFLYREGALASPRTLAVAVAIGFVTMMLYLAAVAYGIGRSLTGTLREIQLGTELMSTVHPDHRLEVRTGDELQALATEINRMADRVRDARAGLEHAVAAATAELGVERAKLSSVLEALGEGVVVATLDGRVSLANRAAQDLLAAEGAGLLGRSLFEHVDGTKVGHFLDRLQRTGGGAERFGLEPRGGGVLDTVMTPFFDAAGGLVGFILVLRDVTRPARLDEERRRRAVEALRGLRDPLASVRSLSESLLAEASAVSAPARPIVEAIHAEAVRLSGVVRALAEPEGLDLARLPWHFEEVTIADLAAITLRRLAAGAGGAERVTLEMDAAAVLPLRVEASALSGTLAYLLRLVLGASVPTGAAWLRSARSGGVLQVDAAAAGDAAPGAFEALLDRPLPPGIAGPLTPRDVVHRHAGEVWAYAADGRVGFRLTLPIAVPREAVPAARGPRFVGAGTVSGTGGGPPAERPAFYDFSLFEAMARRVAPADRERPLAELTCVVLDTETTGLDPEGGDRVVSLAAVTVRGAVLRRGETFDALVNPGRPVPPASTRFHGVTDTMVAEAPPMNVVLPAFLRFAEDAVLVGHQVWFDLRFLEREAERLGLPPIALARPVLDTLVLSELVHGQLPEHGLEAVARRLGVTIHGRHSALGDALATAEVFVRLVTLLERRGIRTLGQALDATHRARAPRSAAEGGA